MSSSHRVRRTTEATDGKASVQQIGSRSWDPSLGYTNGAPADMTTYPPSYAQQVPYFAPYSQQVYDPGYPVMGVDVQQMHILQERQRQWLAGDTNSPPQPGPPHSIPGPSQYDQANPFAGPFLNAAARGMTHTLDLNSAVPTQQIGPSPSGVPAGTGTGTGTSEDLLTTDAGRSGSPVPLPLGHLSISHDSSVASSVDLQRQHLQQYHAFNQLQQQLLQQQLHRRYIQHQQQQQQHQQQFRSRQSRHGQQRRQTSSLPEGHGQGTSQMHKPVSYADALLNPALKQHLTDSSANSSHRPPARNEPQQTEARPNRTRRPARQRPRAKAQLPEIPGTNPTEFDVNPPKARCFVIKSYNADDVHKSIKYSVWASTQHGNKRLDAAFKEAQAAANPWPVYLFFSVNGSRCFCGMAQMTSAVDYNQSFGAWAQDHKWSGQFGVRWIFIKNIPNREMRNIRLPNNLNKAVTNSRDTQEVLAPQSHQVLRMFRTYQPTSCILQDFDFYDREEKKRMAAKRQEEAKSVPKRIMKRPTSNAAETAELGNGNAGPPATPNSLHPS